jgi:hypothetical protein
MAKRKKSRTIVKAQQVGRNLWSSKDVRLLRKLATRHSARDIAAALSRSVLALRYKAHMLAISLRRKSSSKLGVRRGLRRKK